MEAIKIARYILAFLLVAYARAAAGADIKGSISARYHFLDSVKIRFDQTDPKAVFVELDQVEKWAEGQSHELALELELMHLSLAQQINKVSVEEFEGKYLSIINEAHAEKMKYLEADALQAMGEAYASAGQLAHAFECYMGAYIKYVTFPKGDFPPKQRYLFALGGAYYRYGDNENAVRYLKESIAEPNFYINKNFTIYNTLGLSYRNMHKYDSAQMYFKIVYDSALACNDTVWAGIVSGNIGSIYFRQKRYDEAIPLMEKDMEMSISHKILKNAVGSMLGLTEIYLTQHDLVKSEQLLNKAMGISREKHFWADYELSEKLYRQMFKLCRAKGDYSLAATYADSAMTARDSEIVKTNSVQFAKSQEKIELEQHKLAAEKLQNQKQMETLVRNGLIAGIIMLTAIGILFFNRQKLRQKRLEAEKKNAESELDAATLKLDNFRLSVMEKNKEIEQYTTEIERIHKGAEEQTENELLTQLEQSTILTDEQWEDFRNLFEKVHKGFFASMKKKLPDLTQAEIRFLALTKLKLSSKEMAAMLGISPNAIRIYRHRIRKKLNLDKDDMIEELVASI